MSGPSFQPQTEQQTWPQIERPDDVDAVESPGSNCDESGESENDSPATLTLRLAL